MIIGRRRTTAGKLLDWDEQENWLKGGRAANTFVLSDNLIGTAYAITSSCREAMKNTEALRNFLKQDPMDVASPP